MSEMQPDDGSDEQRAGLSAVHTVATVREPLLGPVIRGAWWLGWFIGPICIIFLVSFQVEAVHRFAEALVENTAGEVLYWQAWWAFMFDPLVWGNTLFQTALYVGIPSLLLLLTVVAWRFAARVIERRRYSAASERYRELVGDGALLGESVWTTNLPESEVVEGQEEVKA